MGVNAPCEPEDRPDAVGHQVERRTETARKGPEGCMLMEVFWTVTAHSILSP